MLIAVPNLPGAAAAASSRSGNGMAADHHQSTRWQLVLAVKRWLAGMRSCEQQAAGTGCWPVVLCAAVGLWIAWTTAQHDSITLPALGAA